MHILVLDIGGTNVKVWKTGESDKTKVPSGKRLTPTKLLRELKEVVKDWHYDRVSIGYPGDVLNGHPTTQAYSLGPGWVDFDYTAAFGCPVRVMNDACMQALGSYEGGRMLYMGLGTNMGCTFIIDGKIVPLALGHLKFMRATFNDWLSRAGYAAQGVQRWQRAVIRAASALKKAFLADYVVIGGGNAKKLKDLPSGCRRGGNHNAYFGGLRMWEDSKHEESPTLAVFPEQKSSAV